jgi:hypothetical protein
MPEERHRHTRRKRIARLYLAAIILLIACADALFVLFCFGESNPFPTLKGLMFGQIFAALLLAAGVWQRLAWARYVLMLLLLLMTGIFGMVTLVLGSRPDLATQKTYLLLTGGILLLLVANTWLLFSKRLQYLAASSTS